MAKNKRSGLMLALYAVVYVLLASATAYVISLRHVSQANGTIESLQEMGVSVHLQKDGSAKYVDLFGHRDITKIMPLVGELGRLEMLTLSGTKVTDEQLEEVAKLKDLQIIALSSTGVSDAGLAHLKDQATLKVLNLDDCSGFTDNGIGHFANSTSLEKIHMNHTPVTNGSIEHLMTMPNLKHVLAYDTKIDKEGAAKLKAALPNVNVVISK